MRAPRGGGAAGFAVDGLRTDQAPPLSIPASFFLLAPIAMIASGALLATSSSSVIASRWLPLAFAATHIGTLGYLGSIMLGALYQMIPVVAGAPVPAVRLAHVVHLAWIAGAVTLIAGLGTGSATLTGIAPVLLGAALITFLAPVAIALVRAPTRSETVHGMRIAVAGLTAIATLGIVMALARAGKMTLKGDWVAWVTAHASLGALVWIGGLITAVSWQVIPMFYLTAPLPRWSRIATIIAVGVAAIGLPILPALGAHANGTGLIALPAAIMVWLVQPALVMFALVGRKRRRADASLEFWYAGLACAPVALMLTLFTLTNDHPRWSAALGFVVVWGWAGLIAHGMLSRIVPFLVWFHRFAALVGRADVPSMKGLLPDRRVRLGLWAHAGGVGVGLVAILGGIDALARLSGIALVIAGAVLGANLVHVLRQRPSATMLAQSDEFSKSLLPPTA